MTHQAKYIFPDDFFENTFNYYSSGLLVYAKHYVMMYDIAEDIVHDVFVNYWEKRDNIDKDKIKSYLFTATRNSCLNYLIHLKARTKYQNEILQEKGLSDSFNEDFYVPVEMKALIYGAIEKLTPQRKKVFMMHRFEKKTIAQIGAELNISPKTVDKHLELSLRDLRVALSDYFYILLYLYFSLIF